MSNYGITLVRHNGKNEVYACDEYTETPIPTEGYYLNHLEKIGLNRDDKAKLEFNPIENGVRSLVRLDFRLPRDGKMIYITNRDGNTVMALPRKKEREKEPELKVLEEAK